MNCPHCGADTKNAVTICPLCGKTLDREGAYAAYIAKGDNSLLEENPDMAALNYKKALEYSPGNEEIFLKLGNIYNKKGDKQAAAMYMKALTFNYYNDNTHNMLITLYSKYRRLDDLKTWYGQSRGKADPAYIDKYIKIIDNVRYFTTQSDVKISVPKDDHLAGLLISSMKKYMIMNIVMGIVIFIIALAVIAGVVLKVNTTFILVFSGFFFAASIVVVFVARRRKTNKSDGGRQSLSDIMAEVSKTSPGSEKFPADKQTEMQDEDNLK